MSPEILGVLIGAGSATITTLIVTALQFIRQGRDQEIRRLEIKRDVTRNFEERRLGSIIAIHQLLTQLLDDDLTAKEAYNEIRTHWFFVSSNTESAIRNAIRMKAKNTSVNEDVLGENFQGAFLALEDENLKNMRQYYE